MRETAKANGKADDDDLAVMGGSAGAGAALGVGGAITIGLAGAGAANAWNPVGWALLIAGAITAVGGLIIGHLDNDSEESEEKALEELAKVRAEKDRDLTAEEINEIANKYDKTGDLGKSLTENEQDLEATNKLIEEMSENTKAIRKNNELILS
jgi:uncharacterized protein HemX